MSTSEFGRSKHLDPKYDPVFKRIFGSATNKAITISFIKDVTNLDVAELTFIDSHLDTDIAEKPKGIVGILCKTTDGRKIMIEIQKCYQKNFRRRLLYYGCKVFTNLDSETMTIIIAISNFPLHVSNPKYISKHLILDTETYKNDLDGIAFYMIDLTKFNLTNISQLESATDVWSFFLKYIDKIDETAVNELKSCHPWIINAINELEKYELSQDERLAYIMYTGSEMRKEQYADYAVDYATERVKECEKSMAKSLLAHGFATDVIYSVTGLIKDVDYS